MSKVPGHKFQAGVTPTCQCGWKGATFFGKGARTQATCDWQSHVSRHVEGAK